METQRKEIAPGVFASENYPLDNIIDAFKEAGVDNDELIKKITIQNYEYTLRCINSLLAKGGQTRQSINHYWSELEQHIFSKIEAVKAIKTNKN